MKRGMLAVLLFVCLASLAWGADWYRYRGVMSVKWRSVAGEVRRQSSETTEVWFCYDTIPFGIDIGGNSGDLGHFDQEGKKLQFRAISGGTENPFPGGRTWVGTGSFNADRTTVNLQASVFYRSGGDVPYGPEDRSWFGQWHFRGQFVDIITRP